MKRTRSIKKVTAILTSDWHLREDTPLCRTDDFQSAQWAKVSFVKELQIRYGCPVIHAGDLFQHWKPSPWLLSRTIENIPDRFYTVYGQHDLPNHNLKLAHKSGIHTLEKAGKLTVLYGVHWGQEPDDKNMIFVADGKPEGGRILVWHIPSYNIKKPEYESVMATTLLRKYPQYDIIVTGDNHTPFVETYKGRILVNPGSLTRQSAAQYNHKPRVYLYFAGRNKVEAVYIPIVEGIISQEHLIKKEERDDRITTFINGLSTDFELGISFEENIENYAKQNKLDPEVLQIIRDAIL